MNSQSEASSQASVESISDSNGPEDSKQFGSASKMSIAKESSLNTGQEYPSTEISEIWMGRASPALMYLSEDSLVKTSALQARARVLRKAIAPASGSSMQESLASYGHDGSSSRTSQDSLETDWSEFWRTLGASIIKRSDRFFWKQPQSAHLTSGRESSLWLETPKASQTVRSKRFIKGRTPNPSEFVQMWPTPRSHESEDYTRDHGLKSKERPTLTGSVRMFPTPQTFDAKMLGTKQSEMDRMKKNQQVMLVHITGGKLNPTWVAWLMGFPLEWTVLKLSATPSSRNAPK